MPSSACKKSRQQSPTPHLSEQPVAPALYPLSLHDALPICNSTDRSVEPPSPGVDFDVEAGIDSHVDGSSDPEERAAQNDEAVALAVLRAQAEADRKSTRLNSSHVAISYAVFCMQKKSPAVTYPALVRATRRPRALPALPTRRSSDLQFDRPQRGATVARGRLRRRSRDR